MKSLLVDALRQKDEGQESEGLSDSGSFATPRADLEMAATGAFIVPNDEKQQEAVASGGVREATDVALSVTIEGETTRVIVGDAIVPVHDSLPSMPTVARYTPLACVILALLSALTWFGVQQLELQQERSQLAAGTSALRINATADEDGIGTTASRFRYLDHDGQPLDDEAWQ